MVHLPDYRRAPLGIVTRLFVSLRRCGHVIFPNRSLICCCHALANEASVQQMSDLASYNDLENAVLNAVAAIHCLSVERNSLRHRLEANESQIGSLRDANEHLRRQIVLIGDSYKDYAASCANSLEGVALAMRAAEHNAKAEASDAASGGVTVSRC